MAQKTDSTDALSETSEQASAPVAQESAALAAQSSVVASQTTAPASAVADVEEDVTPIDPQEELRTVAKKLRKMNKPRSLQETLALFKMIRNIKWGVSMRNGMPVDISNPDWQWEKNKQIRGANWFDVAKMENQWNLDIRGENHQLWFTQEPDRDENGNIIKKYVARPVKGYNDDDLPPPQQREKHWLSNVRPDIYSRFERLVAQGGGIALPPMPAAVDDIGKVLAIFEQDLSMAERNLAKSGIK